LWTIHSLATIAPGGWIANSLHYVAERTRLFAIVGAALVSTAAGAETLPSAPPQPSPPAVPDQLTEVYRSWTVSCRSAAGGGGRTCTMEQAVIDGASKQTLLRLVITPGTDGVAAATLIAPFGLELANGIVLDVDGGESFTAPFKSCYQFGCVAPLALDGKRREAMRTGGAIRARMAPADDPSKTLDLKLSLDGFTNALKRLEELR
jgi:invasion protein IalB